MHFQGSLRSNLWNVVWFSQKIIKHCHRVSNPYFNCCLCWPKWLQKKFGLVDCSLLVIVIVLQDETRVGLRSGAFKSSDANHRLRYFPSCWHFESVTGCVYVGSTFCGVLSDPHHIQSTHNSRTSSLQFQNCFNYSFFYICVFKVSFPYVPAFSIRFPSHLRPFLKQFSVRFGPASSF